MGIIRRRATERILPASRALVFSPSIAAVSHLTSCPRAVRWKRGKLKQSFFVPGAVNLLKTQEGGAKRTQFWAITNWQRTPCRLRPNSAPELASHRLDDIGQRIERSNCSVHLPPAVI